MSIDVKPSASVVINKEIIDAPSVPVYNPARCHEVVGHVSRTPVELVEKAIESADQAVAEWGRLAVHERADMIEQALDGWNATAHERAVLLSREQGKVLWEAVADTRGPEIISRYFIDHAAAVLAATTSHDDRGRIETHRVPYGPTAVIVPWNTPVYLSFQHIIPALIAGNTVLVKVPDNAPLAVSQTIEQLIEVLPTGVLHLVPGLGTEVGSVLSSHPKIRQVLFTGSLGVGQTILRASADTIKNVGLELGGNDPAVILPDAPITEEMIDEIVRGVFSLSGQICFNIKRIHVHEAQLDEFTTRFKAAVDEIRVGDAMDPETTMGPVNNKKEFDRLMALADDVRASGATVTVHGSKVDPDTWEAGYFMLPHVVTDIDPELLLVQEEQFGPMIPILGYSDLDSIIAELNTSDFGLGASVWSPDSDYAFDVAARLEAGTVFVNVHRIGASDMTVPFGGMKLSGLGRTHASDILLECTEPQVRIERMDKDKLPGPHIVSEEVRALAERERNA